MALAHVRWDRGAVVLHKAARAHAADRRKADAVVHGGDGLGKSVGFVVRVGWCPVGASVRGRAVGFGSANEVGISMDEQGRGGEGRLSAVM